MFDCRHDCYLIRLNVDVIIRVIQRKALFKRGNSFQCNSERFSFRTVIVDRCNLHENGIKRSTNVDDSLRVVWVVLRGLSIGFFDMHKVQ